MPYIFNASNAYQALGATGVQTPKLHGPDITVASRIKKVLPYLLLSVGPGDDPGVQSQSAGDFKPKPSTRR